MMGAVSMVKEMTGLVIRFVVTANIVTWRHQRATQVLSKDASNRALIPEL